MQLNNIDNSVNLSLIIATYQGISKLSNLLKSIIDSTKVPKEIIIVHTEEDDLNYLKKEYADLNIKLIVSKIKNQVYQRKHGFKYINYDYILQIDDDIIFERNAIQKLYENIIFSNKKIISANILNKDLLPADSRWVKTFNKFYLFRLLLFLLNNFKKVKGNSIIASGRVIPDIDKNPPQWLNSSLCFHKSCLIDYETIDHMGKSFYEDVFTSHNFYLKGYMLEKIYEAIIYHPNTEKMNLGNHLKTIKNQIKIVDHFSKSKIFFILDVIFFTIIFTFRF